MSTKNDDDIWWGALGWIAWGLFLIFVIPTRPGYEWIDYACWAWIVLLIALFIDSVWRARRGKR
jgi:hypothetical protein